MAIIQLEFDDCCKPLNMNGLKGRMIYLPTSSRKTTEILVVYGQHSSLERWWGLLQYLHHYGNVTAPDLPGFGGMQSFYTIDQRPTLDNFADYLAAFIKLRYKRKRLVIIGMSFGFVVVTRMLQRYPELVKKVDVVTSLAGYMHYSDFRFTLNKLRRLRVISLVLSWRILAILFRHTCLTPFALRWALTRINPRQQILAVNTNDTEQTQTVKEEINLWCQNDIRTHAVTLGELLRLNNCTKPIALPVWQVEVDGGQYLDSGRVEQHLRITYPQVHIILAPRVSHALDAVDVSEASRLIPDKLRRMLARL